MSLVKGQGQTLAGDRVEGTRGVSEQGEIAANDGTAPLFERAGATIGAFDRGALQSIPKSWKAGQEVDQMTSPAGATTERRPTVPEPTGVT